jgi:hypothetical protein
VRFIIRGARLRPNTPAQAHPNTVREPSRRRQYKASKKEEEQKRRPRASHRPRGNSPRRASQLAGLLWFCVLLRQQPSYNSCVASVAAANRTVQSIKGEGESGEAHCHRCEGRYCYCCAVKKCELKCALPRKRASIKTDQKDDSATASTTPTAPTANVCRGGERPAAATNQAQGARQRGRHINKYQAEAMHQITDQT